MAQATTVLASRPPVSRYRSQRKANSQLDPSAPAEPLPNLPPQPSSPSSPVENDNLARSRSRYRRPNTARPATAHNTSNTNVSPSSPPATNIQCERRPATHRGPPASKPQPPGLRAEGPCRVDSGGVPDSHKEKEVVRQKSSRYASERAKQTSHGTHPSEKPRQRSPPWEKSQQRSPPENPAAPATARPSPPPPVPPEHVQAEPVKTDGPPTSGQIRATKSMSELPRYSDVNNEPEGCFGLFKRKRVDKAIPDNPLARPVMAKDGGPPVIKAGGGGIVPGIDAPISAVNAGDRRVLVECGKSKTIFPVTPTTTPVDLIKSAANVMSERIEVHSAVLLEYFGTVGVQRPLRRYEHIRDVLNSWDSDRQNSLLLTDPGTGSSETELSIAGVPLQRPDDASWLLFYSQKPGKWDKRLITLKSEGQLICQKDPNKPQTENVCHLSDFDIYTPTQDKTKKKIRPPKKYCFAIKSQQKSSMFESTENFVHFFSSGDRQVAEAFHSAIQNWRSWYLVNVLGEGISKPVTEAPLLESGVRGSSDAARGHRQQESFGSHYQLGSFKPLLDMDAFETRQSLEKRRSFSGQSTPPLSGAGVSVERRTSNKRAHPPITRKGREHLAYDEPLANLARRTSSKERGRSSTDGRKDDNREFSSNGLLGRSYSQRQREVGEREKERPEPFTTGPSLLNSINPSYDDTIVDDYSKRASQGGMRRSSSQRNREGDLQRRQSQRASREPLVDLTPQYQEPPQHARKGRGHKPDWVGPGGLIDNATSPDDPMGIPPSTDWRARPQAPLEGRNQAYSSSRHRPNTSRTSDTQAFTGEGLLAGAGQQGWGTGDRGRGYMDGSHAKGPMLSINDTSKFVPGSLLNRVDQVTGRQGPVIDREKRNERYEATGEMF